jgi:hypothetical protein
MLEACPALESLSTTMPLVPPVALVVFDTPVWVLLVIGKVNVHTDGWDVPKNR